MSHSTWVALSVASLYLVYVTMRGRLPSYLATVLGPFPSAETGSKPGHTGGAPDFTIDPGPGNVIPHGSETLPFAPS